MTTSVSAIGEESDCTPAVVSALRSCRRVFLSVYNEGLLDARPGSPAAHDFAAAETGPGGPWPREINQLPRTLAAKLVRQQADLCAGAALLVKYGETSEALHSVVRTSFEFAVRAFWVLDPKVAHRVRCARAALAEVVSARMTLRAASKLPDTSDLRAARTKLRTDSRAQTARLRELFATVKEGADGDPLLWTIEGVHYAGWTEIANLWAGAEGMGVRGGAMYDQLSILAHPQGYTATVGLKPDPEDGTRVIRVIDTVRVIKVARLCAQTFYSSAMLLANYHGHRSDHVIEWESELSQAFPGFFR